MIALKRFFYLNEDPFTRVSVCLSSPPPSPPPIFVGAKARLMTLLGWVWWLRLRGWILLEGFKNKHCIIPFGKFGPPYLGKAAAAARATQSYKCMLGLVVFP